jgi:polar amino acid transport system substrate-binding protein
MLAVLSWMTLSVGCASNSTNSGPACSATRSVSVSKLDDIAASVPDKIKSSGKLVVGTNPPYAPNEFKDPSGKIIGFDVDLMNAITGTLGLTMDCRESDFDKIIPSIQAGTYDVGMSSFTDTKDREKAVDFVDYFNVGSQWAQRAGASIDPNNACGLKVSVQSTTRQETAELPAASDACVKAGKPPINIVKFDQQDAATNAVVLGQVDAMAADAPITTWAISQSNGKLAPAGAIFDFAPYGWPVAKGSPLGQALLKALSHIIQTGDYKTVATNWGVQAGMIQNPVINGAVN